MAARSYSPMASWPGRLLLIAAVRRDTSWVDTAAASRPISGLSGSIVQPFKTRSCCQQNVDKQTRRRIHHVCQALIGDATTPALWHSRTSDGTYEGGISITIATREPSSRSEEHTSEL